MSFGQDYPLEYGYSAESMAAERAGFIRRTYSHLAGAILAFMGIEAALLSIPGIEQNVFGLLVAPYSWLFVLGAFMAVGWLAEHWARSQTSRSTQYLGLSLYVVAEAIIFLPMLILAQWVGVRHNDPNIIGTAGSEKGRELVKRLGAQHVLDHRSADYLKEIMSITQSRGVNLVLEMLANVNLAKDLSVLAKFGRVVVIGSRGPIEIDPRETMSRDADIRGMTLTPPLQAGRGRDLRCQRQSIPCRKKALPA